MNDRLEIPTLNSLDYLPYLNEEGYLLDHLQGKIGVYAIFDAEKILQFVGYSRDIYLSLKQHLARQPQDCYWLKIQTIERPSRSILEEIRQTWIGENGRIDRDEKRWTESIDAKLSMTDPEKETYQKSTEFEQIKLLKNVSRRVESEILKQLQRRGVQMEIRFNPKLKEQGLLDLK